MVVKTKESNLNLSRKKKRNVSVARHLKISIGKQQ